MQKIAVTFIFLTALFFSCERVDNRKVFNDSDKKNFAQDSLLYHEMVVQEKESFQRLNYIKDSTGIFSLPVEDSLKAKFSKMLSSLEKDSLGFSEAFLVKRKVSRRVEEIFPAVMHLSDTMVCYQAPLKLKTANVYKHFEGDSLIGLVHVLNIDSAGSACMSRMNQNESLKNYLEIKELKNKIKIARDEKNYMYQVWGGKFR